MSKSNHTEAQMIGALKQLEAGRKAEDVAREVGVSKIPSLENGDAFMRILMSPDADYIYGSGNGCASILNTSTGSNRKWKHRLQHRRRSEDMAISSDGSVLPTADLLTDPLLNVEGDLTYGNRDVWLALSVYGQKLNSNASLVFTACYHWNRCARWNDRIACVPSRIAHKNAAV
jgi:hypothetical protein